MDEPTASLTQREQERLYEIVRGLRAGGTGVVYISHRLEEIRALGDRVTVLRDGLSVGTRAVGEVRSVFALAVSDDPACRRHATPPAVLDLACGGMHVTVTPAAAPGEDDRVVIRPLP